MPSTVFVPVIQDNFRSALSHIDRYATECRGKSFLSRPVFVKGEYLPDKGPYLPASFPTGQNATFLGNEKAFPGSDSALKRPDGVILIHNADCLQLRLYAESLFVPKTAIFFIIFVLVTIIPIGIYIFLTDGLNLAKDFILMFLTICLKLIEGCI